MLRHHYRNRFWAALTFLVLAVTATVVGYVTRERLAQAQTTQIVYTRPSKGQPILLSAMKLDGAGTMTSAVYDWSAYQNVAISVSFPGSACAYVPRVLVKGSQVAASGYQVLQTPNAGRTTYAAVSSYPVRVLENYIQIGVTQAAGLGSDPTCTATIGITPLPFDVQDAPVNSFSAGDYTLTTTAQLVTDVGSFPVGVLIVQNTGSVVAHCGVGAGSAYINMFDLAACTSAGDGTGGSFTLNHFDGLLNCKTASGSTTLNVTQY